MKKIFDEISKIESELGEISLDVEWPSIDIQRWRNALSNVGITLLDLPNDLGGNPVSTEEMLAVYLRLGGIDLNLRDLPGLGHSRLFGSSDSRELKELALKASRGLVLTSIASTENGVGSDLKRVKTLAVRTEGGFQISGHKVAVYRLLEATHFVVFAQLEGKPALFACESRASGIKLTPRNCIGLTANSWGEILLENVYVPNANQICPRDDAMEVFSMHFAFWRIAMSAACIGAARRAIDLTSIWMSKREVFGKILLTDNGIMRQMEHFRGSLYCQWILLQHIAKLLDSKADNAAVLALYAKANFISETHTILNWCQEHIGWRGCLSGSAIVRFERDLACLRVSSGATDALMDSLARRWAVPLIKGNASGVLDHYEWPVFN